MQRKTFKVLGGDPIPMDELDDTTHRALVTKWLTTDTERQPDTVTFTMSEERVYAVTGSHLSTGHNSRTLTSIDLFAEGEFVVSYGPEDEIERGDLDLITSAAAVAGISVASLSEYQS